jgi:hypothetical protein
LKNLKLGSENPIIEVVGSHTFADLPEEIRMIVLSSGDVYFNLKYKAEILSDFMD